MATTRRTSTRTGLVRKDDENSQAFALGAGPAGSKRVTKSVKQISVVHDKTSISKPSGLAANNNPRKRILNDRTNAPRSTTAQLSTAPLLTTDLKKPALVRKPSIINTDEADVDRPIKVIRRSRTVTSNNLPVSSVNVVRSETTSVRCAPAKPTISDQRTLRKLSGRLARVTNNNQDLEDNESAESAQEREAKRFKTSPDHIEIIDDVDLYVEENAAPEKVTVISAPEKPLKEGEEGWVDLDEGDELDFLMVQEYVVDVYDYMREIELNSLADGHYMSRQTELTWKMRGILTDWLIEVHTKFRLLPETIFLACNLIDRFLSIRSVSLVKFQLVGITALFIAAKYEEVVSPSVANYLFMTDGGYQVVEILKAERYMLQMLGWDMSYPNPLNFLRRISKADGYDIHSRTLAKYFMEISVVDHRLITVPPSQIAAAATWLARKVLDRGDWDANLVHYSGYSERECLPTAQLMLDYVLRSYVIFQSGAPEGAEHANFHKKYASKKFYRASEVVRSWAAERYIWTTDVGREVRTLEEWEFLGEVAPSSS